MSIKGAVRRSQLITTYGVGAVIALGDESFMVAGIDRWPVRDTNLHEPRLEAELGVHGFVVPPASDGGDDIPVVRFPRWHTCPKCKRLDDHYKLTSFDSNKCGDCNRTLVPSRFVTVCPRGHIDDFPYKRWVHEGRASEGTHELRIETMGATASLRDIKISCDCGASRTMDKAFDRFALRDVTRCFGNRPWLGKQQEGCEEPVRALQRGASNVWFGSHRSVISIPPWSDSAFQLLDKYWDILRALSGSALATAIEATKLAAGTSFTTDDLVEAVRERKRRQEGDTGPKSEESLRRDEYRALIAGQKDAPGSQFAAHDSPVATTIDHLIAKVMLATRLREVRALQGFSRILPPSGGTRDLAPIFTSDPGWRPAIEVRGEGIFLTLHTDSLAAWEKRADVTARTKLLDKRYSARAERWGIEPDREITPRLVLIHTLAHALIDQLALDAGYPAAALRERLYASEDMQGLLLYTATTDSAGSLGGLIAQGETDRLEHTLHGAVARSAWCSSDPVCIEADGQGADALNLAACHACALLPETSCEEMNMLLDRALLVGTPEQPQLGFFAGLLTEA
jgi:Domain of unknown function (DUF1998)